MKKIFLALVLVLAMVGCTSANKKATAGLTGTWQVVQLLGDVVPETMSDVNVQFAEDWQFGGQTGVNRVRGTYSLDGDKITFGETATTKMMGDSISDLVEQYYLTALNNTISYAITDSALYLLGVDDEILMELAKTECE